MRLSGAMAALVVVVLLAIVWASSDAWGHSFASGALAVGMVVAIARVVRR
jgi:hypothetical protein